MQTPSSSSLAPTNTDSASHSETAAHCRAELEAGDRFAFGGYVFTVGRVVKRRIEAIEVQPEGEGDAP